MMKTLKIYIITLLQILWIAGFAQNTQADEIFEKASQYYQNQEYTQSIILYDSLLNMGIESSELYYNLGNSYYKKEDYARAILNYEKSKKINPGDKDLEHNLAICNERIADKIDPLPTFVLTQWWNGFVNIFSEKQWAFINLFLWAAAMVFAYFFFTMVGGRGKKIVFWIGITTLIFSLITGLSGYKQYQNTTRHKTAIVMTPTVNIKSSPSDESSTVFVIHQGTKIKLKVKIKDWYQIKIANGNQGWIREDDLEKI